MANFATRLRQALDMNNMSPAELSRRTKISEGGISQYLSGKVLGHAQSSTTMEIYVHLLEQDKTAQALQALQNFMN